MSSRNYGNKCFRIELKSHLMKRQYGRKKSLKKNMKIQMKSGSLGRMEFGTQNDLGFTKKMFLELWMNLTCYYRQFRRSLKLFR